ncbi:MAG: MBL fold metallo-hydrolase [Rickettsiales bacterium]|nr:MBL fold metallo-hydrolase [Rickettsiales bacterium]
MVTGYSLDTNYNSVCSLCASNFKKYLFSYFVETQRKMTIRLAILFFCILFNTSVFSENTNSPTHHLPDGTYSNTNGIPYESSFKKLLKWSWERRSKELDTYKFEITKPNFEEIYKNENIAITWIGHETFLYQNKELNILTDPHFTERASPFTFAGPKRYTAPGMSIDDLPDIDVVTISHSHYDHLDYRSVKLLSNKFENIIFLVPLGLKEWFEGKGILKVREFDWWETTRVKNTEITFAPVQHWSARGLFDRNETLWGAWHFKNYFHSFIHLGDTGYSEDFKEIRARLGKVDLAAIPIGAYEPRWIMKVSHMNPEEAVKSFLDLEANKAIGMNWGTFRLTDEPATEPLKRLTEATKKFGVSNEVFFTVKHGQTYLDD